MNQLAEIAKEIARAGLGLGAIKLSPRQPFTWASGFQMPVYNDNRKLLASAKDRALIATGFVELLEKRVDEFDVIAGIATAGIPHATTLADRLTKPLVYVRASSKEHGLGKRVEGVLTPQQRALMVEDVVSTGKSSLSAVQAIRDEGGVVTTCLAIFNYGFPETEALFRSATCALRSILTFDTLIEVATVDRIIGGSDIELLRAWKQDPFNWGAANGFPQKVK